MDKYEFDEIQLFYEEPIIIKIKYKHLASTADQIKLVPEQYKRSYVDNEYKLIFNKWYSENRGNINNLFNKLVKVFVNKPIYFNTDLKTVYDYFVEYLYYYS